MNGTFFGRKTELVSAARLRYGANEFTLYHTWEHAREVAESVEQLGGDEATYMAALYHDVVYYPGAINDANENASAALWGLIARGRGVPEKEVSLVSRLIRGTTVSNHLTSKRYEGSQAILNDADLKSLASTWEVFTVNQRNIIQEHSRKVDVETLSLSANFLLQFLEVRPWIYHTEPARALYEAQARENIERWAKEAKGFA